MQRSLTLAAIGASAVLCARAEAELVRFTFTGTLTTVTGQGTLPPEIEIGGPFTVSFVFDTLATDTDPSGNFGFYDPSVLSAAADVNGLIVSATGGYISVLNNGFLGDTLFYESATDAYLVQVSLTDSQRTAIDTDELPADLDFPQWDVNRFYLGDLMQPDSWTAVGTVTGFEREVVPGPGGAAVLALGAAVGARRRRR